MRSSATQDTAETLPLRLVRFPTLKRMGLVSDWRQLRRMQDSLGFPKGYMLSPNVRVWELSDIENWLKTRREPTDTAA